MTDVLAAFPEGLTSIPGAYMMERKTPGSYPLTSLEFARTIQLHTHHPLKMSWGMKLNTCLACTKPWVQPQNNLECE